MSGWGWKVTYIKLLNNSAVRVSAIKHKCYQIFLIGRFRNLFLHVVFVALQRLPSFGERFIKNFPRRAWVAQRELADRY